MNIYQNAKTVNESLNKDLKRASHGIEEQRKLILFNAKQEALIIIHQAVKIREEIIDRAIRQSHAYLKAAYREKFNSLIAN